MSAAQASPALGELRLNCGCGYALLEQVAPGSIDALITDTPYGTTELEFDQQPLDFGRFWAAARRAVKPSGVIVMFAADLFTVDLIQSARDIYRYRLVWEKTRATGFLDANRRPLRAHEDVLVFIQKPAGSTYHVQKVASTRSSSSTERQAPKVNSHWGGDKQKGRWSDDGTRHPTSVLPFASVRSQDTMHPTQKPVALMRWLVGAYTHPGDLICDPFAGSGSTGVAAAQLGRRFLGSELNPAHHATAARRLAAVAAQPTLPFDLARAGEA